MTERNNQLFGACFETGFGKMMGVVNETGELCLLYFIGSEEQAMIEAAKTFPGASIVWNSERCSIVIRQLREYFAGERKEFDFPISFGGTEFQNKVWRELSKIPYGRTISYGELAAKIGRPKASRAVGAANGANRIAVALPCHRVIGANGKLTGYAYGVDTKEKLLALEQERMVY